MESPYHNHHYVAIGDQAVYFFYSLEANEAILAARSVLLQSKPNIFIKIQCSFAVTPHQVKKSQVGSVECQNAKSQPFPL